MTDYPVNPTPLSASSLSPPSPKNYIDLNPSTSNQHLIKNVLPTESVASEILPITNSYTIIGTPNERLGYVGETEKIQTDQSNLLTYLKYNNNNNNRHNNNNNNNTIDGTITPAIRNSIDIHNHELTMLNNDCDIAENRRQLNVIQPILECDANKLKDSDDLNQNAMISNHSVTEQQSTAGINRDYEKSEKVLLWNPIMNVINESQNIINNHNIGMDADDDHNVNIMREPQNNIDIPYAGQIKNDFVATEATVPAVVPAVVPVVVPTVVPPVVTAVVPTVVPIKTVSNDFNHQQKQNDNSVIYPTVENEINRSSVMCPISNNNLGICSDSETTSIAKICDKNDTTAISISETKMPLVDGHVNDAAKIGKKEIDAGTVESEEKDETEEIKKNKEKDENVEIEENKSVTEEKIEELSSEKPQSISVCKNLVKPHQHYKKRRRIVRLMGEENEQSSEDELEKIERERVLKTASPPLPTNIESQPQQSPPPQQPPRPPAASQLSPLNIDDLQHKVIIENEKPGPKSKKQSTLLLKELQTRALLENAIHIPSVDKVKGGRKNRVILDDDYEDYSLNTYGIGLPENDHEDIGRTVAGNDDSDLSQSQCVLINENNDLHCESMTVNENEIVIPIDNPIIPQDFDEENFSNSDVSANNNNDDDADDYTEENDDDDDEDDDYVDEENHSNDDNELKNNEIEYKDEKIKKNNNDLESLNPLSTRRNFRNIPKRDTRLKKAIGKSSNVKSSKNDEPSKKIISNNGKKSVLKRKLDPKDDAKSTNRKIIKSNAVNKPQTKTIISPSLNIQYKLIAASSSTDEEHVPNEVYFGTPDRIPYCPPKRNLTGRSMGLTMADQPKTRPTNTAIRGGGGGGGAFNRGSSRSNKPPIKNQYAERSASSSSDSDTTETNQTYNRSKPKAPVKKPQTHQHLQRFQQQQQQFHKQNSTSNIKTVVTPKFIPNDIYFGDIPVPLHILHAYDSASSDEESKKVSSYIPILPTVPNKINNNNNNNNRRNTNNNKNNNTNKKVVTTNIIKSVGNNRNTTIKKPAPVQKSRSVTTITNNQKSRNRSQGGGGGGGGGSSGAAIKRRRSRVNTTNIEDGEIISDERKVKLYKNYLKEAGMFRFNYTKLFEGCTLDSERADKILELLREKGLEGEPTLSKCKQLKKEIQTKKEIEELDTNLIIETQGNRNRRSARAATHRNYVFEDDEDFVVSRRLPPPPRPLPPPPTPPDRKSITSPVSNLDGDDDNESNVSLINNESLETLNKLRKVIDSDSDE